MGYKIKQSEKYVGGDFWQWSAWIEAPPAELDLVKVVTWILHPTFSPSRIETSDRSTKFRLDKAGWGTFVLRAELQVNGEMTPTRLSHKLQMAYPDDSEAISKDTATQSLGSKVSEGARPTVFLSYSSEDERKAADLSTALEQIGARVLNARAIAANLPLDAAIRKLIRESDAVIGIVGNEYASPHVLSEMKLAQMEDKAVLAVLPEGAARPFGLPSEIAELRLGGDINKIGTQFAGFVSKLTSGV